MYGSDEVQDLQLLLQGLREVQIQMVHFLLPENIKKKKHLIDAETETINSEARQNSIGFFG